jgi:2-iminobutanoate/2-iminopropanoate deaminase
LSHDNEHPYSPAFSCGDFVYVSGALSVDKNGNPVRGARAATDAALARLEERLQTAQVGLEHVVKAVYYATSAALRDEANEQFRRCFAEPRPARSFVVVAALPYGADLEIEAVAHRRPVRVRL